MGLSLTDLVLTLQELQELDVATGEISANQNSVTLG